MYSSLSDNPAATIMPTTPASEWITNVSDCLQERWKTIDPARLDDLAADLWRDEALRAMAPREAADEWLRPVIVPQHGD